MSAPVRIAVGARLHGIDGVLEVVALEAHEVTVRNLEDGAVETVALADLVSSDGLVSMADAGEASAGCALMDGPRSVLLDRVPPKARAVAEARLAELREAVTGYRAGTEVEALSHEPRPQYNPRLPQSERWETKAREMRERGEQMSARTLRRWWDTYEKDGLMGLVDKRYQKVSNPLANVPPEFLAALDEVLARYVELSTVDRKVIRREVRQLIIATHPDRKLVSKIAASKFDPSEVIVWPALTWFYEIIEARTRHRGTFGSAKGRKSIANRPSQAVMPLRATRSGEIVQLDSTRLDVMCLDPASGELTRPEISVAIDAYDRCVRAVRVVRSTAKGVDAALLLYDMLVPEPARASWPAHARWNYAGVPAAIVSAAFSDQLGNSEPAAKPFGAPGTVVIDHGKIYRSNVFQRACEEFGISVQPAPPGQPTYKAVVERFFDRLNQGLLQHLGGYTGRSVHERGRGAEASAVLTLEELRELIVDWIISTYHAEPHEGCRLAAMPSVKVTPNRMFEESIARGGFLVVPPHPDTLQRILPWEWRRIQHYGVDMFGLRYSSPVLEKWRERKSGYRDAPDAHPLHFDPRDISKIWFRDPDDGTWHALRRLGAAPETVAIPFSDQALAYAKKLLVEEGFESSTWEVTNDALDELLGRHLRDAGRTPLEQRLFSKMTDEAEEAARAGISPREAGDEAQSGEGDRKAAPRPGSPLPVFDGPDEQTDYWGDIEPLEAL